MRGILIGDWIRIFLSIFFVCSGVTIFAQNNSGIPIDQDLGEEKCAANIIEQKQLGKLGVYGTREYFEYWVDDKIKELHNQPFSLRTQAEGLRKIPVIIHVIHNGTPIGEGANIPMSQIQAQIDVLNEDYRRLNPDAGNTPAEFLPVAADAQIEFVLAKQDPAGLPSNGVNRINGPISSYTPDDAALIGQLALWPPEDYLNIWVVPLQAPYLGYSSFPVSELPGLDFPLNTRETDGVTIDYKVFGKGGNALPTSLGRTTTHEIGHYLGLRHIWGDGGCDVDDFVEDTPNQSQSNNTCRATPRITCESRDMVENFMDYTPDQCMNLFTQGQVERIDVVLSFSPRRASLVNGRATMEPELSADDLSLRTLIEPQDYVCSEEIIPQVSVTNVGNNRITSSRIEISVNGRVLERRNFSLNAEPGASALLTFNPISLPAPTGNDFQVKILSVNGKTDTDLADNVLQSSPSIQPTITAPYNYRTADFSDLWSIKNPDNSRTWEQIILPIDGEQQSLIYLNGFNYETQGELDYFISPKINLRETPNAQLAFQLAFSPYIDEDFQESLLVAVSTDCGNTFELLDAPYHKTGTPLGTQESITEQFFPSVETQFRTELVNLSPYAGHGDIRIAFISLNGYGNNLFLKNIRVYPSEELNYDFKLSQVLSPGPFVDGSQESEVLQITNTGNLPIHDFKLIRRLNGGTEETLVSDLATINPEETITYSLPSTLNEGLNQVEYEILEPNFDQNGGNSSKLVWHYIQDDSTITAPWRQDFEGQTALQPWLSLNPEQNKVSWEITPVQDNQILSLAGMERGNSYWLGSALFDLSNTTQASIFFDRAAGGFSPSDGTELNVLISTDGGESYEQLLSREGEQINSVSGSGPVNPNIPSDYAREFIDLSAYTGEGFDKVRLAFRVAYRSGSTNPIYLDNIELFLSANPDPVFPESGNNIVFPNPATDIVNIAFNLSDYEDVNIQIISAAGHVVHDVVYPNTLNQTYSFSTELFSKGVYIFKISREGISEHKRIIIQ
jgi:hypothetical protein